MKQVKWWFRFYIAHFKEGESDEPYCVKADSEKGLERCLPINGSWHGEAFSIEVKGNEKAPVRLFLGGSSMNTGI